MFLFGANVNDIRKILNFQSFVYHCLHIIVELKQPMLKERGDVDITCVTTFLPREIMCREKKFIISH